MKRNLLIAYILGVAGAILVISGVTDVPPLKTLNILLTGKLPGRNVDGIPPGQGKAVGAQIAQIPGAIFGKQPPKHNQGPGAIP